jgi:erythromycin esterase-like protein
VVADIVTWLREREEAYDESRHRASMRGADVYTIDTLDARAKTYQYAADEIEKRWSGGGECR